MARSRDKVVVACIHPSQVSAWFHHSMIDLFLYDGSMSQRISGKVFEHCGANLSAGRNRLVTAFLDKHDAEWLWMVDADMVFPPNTLDALLEHAHETEVPILGGLCFGVNEGRLFPTMYAVVDNGDGSTACARYNDYPTDSLFQVAATGAACLLIHRSVLVAMRDHGFNPAFPWFQETQWGDKPCGEDITFCLRAGQLGYPVYVNTAVPIGHHKDQLLTEDLFRSQRVEVPSG